MKPSDENIKVLSHAVLSDVRGDAEQVLAEARAKADAIRAQAAEDAAAARAKIMEKAATDAERVRSQAIATTQLKARTMELEEREKLLNNVFQSAQEKLASVQQSRDYEKIAQGLLHEALTQLGTDTANVHADKATAKFFTNSLIESLSKELKVKIQLSEPLAKGMGVIVETADGHRQYDNTLETRLKRMRDALRSPVYHILMGEAQ